MEPSFQIGDCILVEKISGGARFFNLGSAINKEKFTIKRTPKLREINHNDILVFNFPYPEFGWDSIHFDIMKYYVKRCVALPGDTLTIRNGFFKINGNDATVGNPESQQYISTLNDTVPSPVMMHTYPWNAQMKWTVKEFGPLPVPARGQLTVMDSTAFILYHQLIRWEQDKPFTRRGNNVFLGDSAIQSYQFENNYYFMAGDKLENSQDSRYWGLLPEDYIVGKAIMIWKSKDPYSGKIRWNRIGKRIR